MAPAASEAFALSGGAGFRQWRGDRQGLAHVPESAEDRGRRVGEVPRLRVRLARRAGRRCDSIGAQLSGASATKSITDWETFERWLESLRKAELFAFDTGTTSLDYMKAEIVGVSFATEPGIAAYVPVAHDYAGAPEQLNRDKVLAALKPVLEDPSARSGPSPTSTTRMLLLSYGIRLAGMRYDSMLRKSYVWNSVTTRHDDGRHVRSLSRHQDHQVRRRCGQGRKAAHLQSGARRQGFEYSAKTRTSRCAFTRLCAQLQADDPRSRTAGRDRAAARARAPAHGTGRRAQLDRAAAENQSRRNRRAVCRSSSRTARQGGGPEIQHRLAEAAAEHSVREAADSGVAQTPTGQPSTAEDVLEELAARLRSAAHRARLPRARETEVDVRGQTARADQRAHGAHSPSYPGPSTGRTSIVDGSGLQNIPIRRPEGRRIRQAFIAPPGYVLLAVEYSQIELRIMAHLSGDEGLLSAFAEDRDVHQSWATTRAASIENGHVKTPKGFKDAWKPALRSRLEGHRRSAELGGAGAPRSLQVLVEEMLSGSNTAFTMYPGLAYGAAEVIEHLRHARAAASSAANMFAGKWGGTMCLTEPHAGSDVGAATHHRRAATPTAPTTIRGTKIFISGGDHDMADNIVHLVLARVEGARPAPRASRSSSCPSCRINADGSLGAEPTTSRSAPSSTRWASTARRRVCSTSATTAQCIGELVGGEAKLTRACRRCSR